MKYDIEKVATELQNITDWTFKNNGIEKQFQFKNFSKALAFIIEVGVLSEKANHHPELFNVYNKVHIRLTTHDANGITKKDFDLAKAINEL